MRIGYWLLRVLCGVETSRGIEQDELDAALWQEAALLVTLTELHNPPIRHASCVQSELRGN